MVKAVQVVEIVTAMLTHSIILRSGLELAVYMNRILILSLKARGAGSDKSPDSFGFSFFYILISCSIRQLHNARRSHVILS